MADYSEYKNLLTELKWTVQNNKTLNRRLMDKNFVDNLNLGYLISDLRDSAGSLSKNQQRAMVTAIDKTLRDVIEAENNRAAKPTSKETYYESDDSETDSDYSESSSSGSESESDDENEH